MIAYSKCLSICALWPNDGVHLSFDAFYGFQSHSGFELGIVSFTFGFHGVLGVGLLAQNRSHHNLKKSSTGPNYGVHLSIWESVFNPDFNYGEFAAIKSQAGLNSYKMSVKEWVEKTRAIGLRATAGRYGGTFAHPDIAFEFGMWISPEFKIYLVKEFRRLKDEENDRLKLGWNLQRTLAKINYRIHTDAIKETLIPPAVSKKQAGFIYADEADILNVALFGQTAAQWRDAHPDAEGNLRDHAPIEQLVVLTNLESLNSILIRQGLTAPERLRKLNEIAISQMRTLLTAGNTKRLK